MSFSVFQHLVTSSMLLISATGSWGGGLAGGYPSADSNNFSSPGFNAGMVSLAFKNYRYLKSSEYICNALSLDYCIKYSS